MPVEPLHWFTAGARNYYDSADSVKPVSPLVQGDRRQLLRVDVSGRRLQLCDHLQDGSQSAPSVPCPGSPVAVPTVAFLNSAIRVLAASEPAAEMEAQEAEGGKVIEADADDVGIATKSD